MSCHGYKENVEMYVAQSVFKRTNRVRFLKPGKSTVGLLIHSRSTLYRHHPSFLPISGTSVDDKRFLSVLSVI